MSGLLWASISAPLGSADFSPRLGSEASHGGHSAPGGGRGWRWGAVGLPSACQQERWVFLSGCEDADENPRMLCHCGQPADSKRPFHRAPDTHAGVERLRRLLSGPRPRQPMEFQNLSSPAPSPPLPLSSSLSPSSPLPSSLSPSPPSSPSTFTVLGTPGDASGSCLLTSYPLVSTFLAPVLGVEFALGLVGNSLAFFIFCFHTRPWTSSTVFLVSLVIADFLLIINLPLRVDYYFRHEIWRFGAAACKINLFMMSTNRTASVVFLTAIALNRYLKVVRPHHALSRASVGAAARAAAGLWGGILLLNGHLLATTHSSNSCLSYSVGNKPSAALRWHQALYMLEFFLPLALILFAIVSIGLTIRRRSLGGKAGPQRAVRVLAAVVAVFAICFLPSIIFGTATMVASRLRACHALNICAWLFHGSLAFTYLNSVLDPVLYCFSSPNFLRQGRALLGLGRSWQGTGSDESSYQPSAWRREASRKADATMRVQVEGSLK
ncbi:oxoeicosanoid receptor 1 [Choloepus didactylus]|uniref:oxoeicosanoid receptor 1 n=1 Tax=Choloepus didactylus TaxID=27675 RepID=UPI00189EA502|nr:oxoeicosanoid receptor 1 [Choloepus didactylus]XP_037663535.1 oxoeicosanoid receptor 1 [Choloepus didactylus]XP_037663536.1 oxoeicosanoid receptor 1 [Choloepus didactylus]XP_037663537.1 oxoeicosanoid receptor 1 [Choloepus didactylus]XP_037663538.1 oxoeicosanoid receptor 1 [Choloepus didactylus]XP_037663539.1 oxoeicosanoid receptor 1 [Choloepus didactylus]XP_037663541.1 oxoeicosanoid receptor 1 [Choloepus didactylus]XP_037663542.1 oxoeicosanoid receptor 1 [Choloepus didactylus]XP_03766354